MKTTRYIKNLLKTLSLAGIVFIVSTGMNAQPNADVFNTEGYDVYVRLQDQVARLEQDIKYYPPAADAGNDITNEDEIVQRLNSVIAAFDEDVRYTAPVINNKRLLNDDFEAEIARLNNVSKKNEETVKYTAPSAFELQNTENKTGQARLSISDAAITAR